MKIQSLEFSFYLLLMMMMPPLVNSATMANSVAPGLLLFSAALLICSSIRFEINKFILSRSNIKYGVFVYLILVVSSIHSFVIYGELKPIYSLLFIFIIFTALIFSSIIVRLEYIILYMAIRNCVFILAFIGYVSLVWKPSLFGYADIQKSVFPFNEQSHFSLALGVFACAYVADSRVYHSVLVIIILLALSLLFPSLTLLIFSLLSIIIVVIRFRARGPYLLVAFMGCLTLIAVLYFIHDTPYFTDRLTFANSKNLTTMVYIQGWQLAYENFGIDKIFGLGYQMLGQGTTNFAAISSDIFELTNNNYNITDGGFIAAKMISEFGIFGIIFTVWYAYYIIWYLKNINSLESRFSKVLDHGEIKKLRCFMTIAFASLVEFFFRSVGYFSPNFMLFMISLFYVNRIVREGKVRRRLLIL